MYLELVANYDTLRFSVVVYYVLILHFFFGLCELPWLIYVVANYFMLSRSTQIKSFHMIILFFFACGISCNL